MNNAINTEQTFSGDIIDARTNLYKSNLWIVAKKTNFSIGKNFLLFSSQATVYLTENPMKTGARAIIHQSNLTTKSSLTLDLRH
ncbi:hypothetical protein KDN34_17285 [Shewanella yunxiaonensis]|uniref:Uncharacterized protein n=1 Tax=Shewanella yunxiaonensis TaxID=2829809 RepID=A0ABX7YT26_9GAMM|nr:MULTISPECIES: hypothetical protein [Shewanella]MDF0535318.1 hypothetical protein [Shewanella sp. A32]QUN05893.1 hypothetical protein KDN34_17285 [Shewanella yunxiaonensis]